MRTVRTRNPVVVRHPLTGQFVTLARGMEFDDDDPIATDKNNAWAFDEPTEPAQVDSVKIERATRAPGERRPGRPRRDSREQ